MLLSLRAFFFPSFFIFQAGAFDMSSKHGQQLIMNSRQLEQNNNQVDISWMPNYSIKFNKCHSLIQLAGEGQGQNNKNEGNRQLYTQHLIEFNLCPSDTCSYGCQNGGKYITNMREFTKMYMEYKKEAKEQACENIRQNCYNDDDNLCFYQAGMEDCIENQNEGNNNNNREDDIDRYLECQELEMGNNNNNNRNNNYYNNNGDYMYRQYFVGPNCSSNGKSITLGLFLDAGCSVPAEDGIYEKLSGGYSLPYSQKSMIQNDCISCEEVDENENNNNNNNNNQNQEAKVIELCERTYENAGRCEESMGLYYTDDSACQFIKNILPKMEKALLGNITDRNAGEGVAVGLAVAFGIMSAIFALYSFLLFRRIRRHQSKIALNTPADGISIE